MTKVHRAEWNPKRPDPDVCIYPQFIHNGKVFDEAGGLTYLEAMEWLRRDECEIGWGPYKRVRRACWRKGDYIRNGASGGYVRRMRKSYRPEDWEGPDEYHAAESDKRANDWEIVTTHAKWVDTNIKLYGGRVEGFWI
jgi:hypothetical protein